MVTFHCNLNEYCLIGSDWDSEIDDDDGEDTTSKSDSKDGKGILTVTHLMYNNTLIEGHNALAGLGTSGLPDPFTSHSKRGSKSISKPADYFNVYDNDSSEGDDDIEKLLSPDKNVEEQSTTNKPPMTTSVNGDNVNATIPANSTDVGYHSPPPTSNNEHVNNSTVEDDGVEFINPLLNNEDDQQSTSEESESEWEKEIKQKRDQKAADQPSSVTLNQQPIPVVNQKQTLSLDNEQLFPSENGSVSERSLFFIGITHYHAGY